MGEFTTDMLTTAIRKTLIADNECLRAKLTEAAAFLDALAERHDRNAFTREQDEQAAADCRALAERLRK